MYSETRSNDHMPEEKIRSKRPSFLIINSNLHINNIYNNSLLRGQLQISTLHYYDSLVFRYIQAIALFSRCPHRMK